MNIIIEWDYVCEAVQFGVCFPRSSLFRVSVECEVWFWELEEQFLFSSCITTLGRAGSIFPILGELQGSLHLVAVNLRVVMQSTPANVPQFAVQHWLLGKSTESFSMWHFEITLLGTFLSNFIYFWSTNTLCQQTTMQKSSNASMHWPPWHMYDITHHILCSLSITINPSGKIQLTFQYLSANILLSFLTTATDALGSRHCCCYCCQHSMYSTVMPYMTMWSSTLSYVQNSANSYHTPTPEKTLYNSRCLYSFDRWTVW